MTSAAPGYLPVVFGYDISEYALARLFHEATGQKSLMVSNTHRGTIDNSKIIDVRIVTKADLQGDAFIALLKGISAEFPGRSPIFLTNTDELILNALAHRDELPGWIFPYSSLEVTEKASNKDWMAQLLGSLGFPVPAHVAIDLTEPSTWGEALAKVTFPVVCKPEDGSTAYATYRLKGLKKVAVFETSDQALDSFAKLAGAGVDVKVIVQDLIPGDDTTQWVVNGYVDRRGKVTAVGSGQVLLGIHAPELLGNAGTIFVTRNDELIEQGIQIVTAAGIRGFFSLDVKVDPRDGNAYWLDLNARIGRSHYYLKVGGVDVARALLDDVEGLEPPRQTPSSEGLYGILPRFLLNSTYIVDQELRKRVRHAGSLVHPLANPADRHPKRTAYRLLSEAKSVKQMHDFYPKVTESGF